MWQLKVVAFAFLAGFFVELVSTTCPPPPPCDPDSFCNCNEEFSNCSNALCRPQLCSEKDQECVCPVVAYCLRGCVCVEGYLRNDKGDCVRAKDCPKKCKKPNEVYNPRPPPIQCESCDVDPRPVKCGRPPKPGHPDCKGRCVCIDGYCRNKRGDCVPREDCPPEPQPPGPQPYPWPGSSSAAAAAATGGTATATAFASA